MKSKLLEKSNFQLKIREIGKHLAQIHQFIAKDKMK